MIRSVQCNNEGFKKVVFNEGYNVILAERKNSDGQDDHKKTRNGAGKTTLIEIIHFCLGAQVSKNSIFKSALLKGWIFTLTIDINNCTYDLIRGTDNSNKIYINGDLNQLDWELKYDKKNGSYYISTTNINKELLGILFGIEKESIEVKYTPSFRELISYLIRRNIDGYRDPFEYFPKQKAYSRQACNTYFLGLNMEYASKFQELKDKSKGIEDFKKAAKSGVIGDYKLNLGELNTEVITSHNHFLQLKQQIDSFKVHPQYSEITKEANSITEEIHQLSNTYALRKQLLSRYESNSVEEKYEIPITDIEKIYAEAGILFGDAIKKNLGEVVEFHETVISNRKEYLYNEIQRLRREISNIEVQIETLSNNRSEMMKVLDAHGALEEYTLMQERYVIAKQKYEDAKKRLESVEFIEDSKSKIKIENQELLIKSRQDYSERIEFREKAISLFKEDTEFLYPEAGTLTIDLKETGYSFGIDIKNSKSQGVSYMKVFCYDLLLAELGSLKAPFPNFLVHDSTIFDGVDERQIARALKLAKLKSEQVGFQYICMMNSDMIPVNEFDDEFNSTFNDSVILRLDDETETGGLLGIRF